MAERQQYQKDDKREKEKKGGWLQREKELHMDKNKMKKRKKAVMKAIFLQKT
jgi:hypothetical protein